MIAARLARAWQKLRYHVGELRTFLRYPRRLAVTSQPGLTVILYGVPYGDWNGMLSNRALWQDLRVVSEVRRIPALRLLLPRPTDRTVLIPMKTEHAIASPTGYRGLRPDARMARLLNDKEKFRRYMEGNGLAAYCPAHYASAGEAVFPCVVKRLDLSGSIGVEVATSRGHLDEILQSPVFVRRPYILQALVAGTTEYATFCVCKDGRILWHWTFASLMAGPAVVKNEDNDKNRQFIPAPPEVLQQLETVLRPLAYRGPCIVNYKRKADGTVQIFEINPRFGGSLLQPPQRARLIEALGHILADSASENRQPQRARTA